MFVRNKYIHVKTGIKISNVGLNCIFYHGITVPTGAGPPQNRGFIITFSKDTPQSQ